MNPSDVNLKTSRLVAAQTIPGGSAFGPRSQQAASHDGVCLVAAGSHRPHQKCLDDRQIAGARSAALQIEGALAAWCFDVAGDRESSG